jgi:hypothetical protein
MNTNEKTANEIIEELERENQRLRDLICAWWRNAIDPSHYMDKDTVANTIAIVAEKNRRGNEK